MPVASISSGRWTGTSICQGIKCCAGNYRSARATTRTLQLALRGMFAVLRQRQQTYKPHLTSIVIQ